jgi:DNA repair exonuclease SbcCD nuclease subunit
MSKFVYTTDWHIRSRPSDNVGIENYQDVLLDRIEMVLDTDAEFIIHGGDMFHSPDVDDMNLFNSVIKLIYDYGKKIYIVPGSHDMVGYSPESLSWSCLQTLENAGLLTILKSGKNDVNGVPVYAVYPTKDHDLKIYNGLTNTVVVSHNIISPVPLTFPHLLVEDISKVVSQCLFLCGDLHMPFTEFFETCAFINPGPLLKSSLSDKSDDGGFVIIDFDSKTFSCQYSKVVFPAVNIDVKESSKKIRDFSNKLIFDEAATDIIELVTNVSKKMYNDDVVTKEAIEWIKSKK